MSDPFTFCTQGPVEVRHERGIIAIPAWRYGALAVHSRLVGGGWTITHLPTGLTFEGFGIFATAEGAAAAMMAMHTLRNDWASLSEADVDQITAAIFKVYIRHGALRGQLPAGPVPADFTHLINGYAEAA